MFGSEYDDNHECMFFSVLPSFNDTSKWFNSYLISYGKLIKTNAFSKTVMQLFAKLVVINICAMDAIKIV